MAATGETIQTPSHITGETIRIPTHTFFNVNTFNVTKLTSTNYFMWSLQIHALLDGYDLAGFLDGSKVTPMPLLMLKKL